MALSTSIGKTTPEAGYKLYLILLGSNQFWSSNTGKLLTLKPPIGLLD